VLEQLKLVKQQQRERECEQLEQLQPAVPGRQHEFGRHRLGELP
jgi:hypothetical protein